MRGHVTVEAENVASIKHRIGYHGFPVSRLCIDFFDVYSRTSVTGIHVRVYYERCQLFMFCTLYVSNCFL